MALSATSAAFLAAACGSPSAPDANWVQVSEHTTCEALSPQFCTGAFGFTVQNDGRYTVGPADGGATLTGTITATERAQLAADVALVSSSLTTSATCDSAQVAPGVSDRVDLTDPRAGAVSVYESVVGSVCYRAGRDQAMRLHGDVAGLMAKYYPRPFPQT